MLAGPHGRFGALEAQLPQIQFVDEVVDDANCAVLVNPVIESLGKQNALRSILAFDASPHRSLSSVWLGAMTLLARKRFHTAST